VLPNLPRRASKFKNEWNFNLTPLYVSMVRCFGTGTIYLLDPFTSGRTNYLIALFVWLSVRMTITRIVKGIFMKLDVDKFN